MKGTKDTARGLSDDQLQTRLHLAGIAISHRHRAHGPVGELALRSPADRPVVEQEQRMQGRTVSCTQWRSQASWGPDQAGGSATAPGSQCRWSSVRETPRTQRGAARAAVAEPGPFIDAPATGWYASGPRSPARSRCRTGMQPCSSRRAATGPARRPA